MTKPVFVDSGAFIAFLDESDRQHEDVASLFAAPPAKVVTSILVVSETYSWFLHKLGEDAARTFRALLSELPGLSFEVADRAHHAAVERKLDKLRGHKLTYVDASGLVILATRKIRTVWGTDRHFGLEGATVVPGPPPR